MVKSGGLWSGRLVGEDAGVAGGRLDRGGDCSKIDCGAPLIGPAHPAHYTSIQARLPCGYFPFKSITKLRLENDVNTNSKANEFGPTPLNGVLCDLMKLRPFEWTEQAMLMSLMLR